MFIRRSYFLCLMVLCFLFGMVSSTVYETLAVDANKSRRRVRTSDIVKQIELTDGQRKQLDKVLEDSRNRIVALNRSVRPEYDKIRKDTRDHIRKILTEEQRARFNQLIDEEEQRRKLRSEARKTNQRQTDTRKENTP